jgi:hypothetical protein
MKPLHSSISSSELAVAETRPPREGPTLLAFPRPTPAAFVAAVTFVALGTAFGYIGGWSHGSPPTTVHPRAIELAYLYNATNHPRQADIIFLGDSLVEMGVVSDLFASSFKLKAGDVKNLGMAGAKPWDVEWLVERLEQPRADGPKLALIGIDRAWFDIGEAPLTSYGRCKIDEDREASRNVGKLGQLRDHLGYLLPQRRETRAWFLQFYYDWLGYRYPKLVRVPSLLPPPVWDLPPEMQKRASASIDTRSRRSLQGGEFAENSVSALRLIIDRLKQRSYRVVLFMSPLRRDALDSIDTSPATANREMRMRRLITAPAYLGAEGFVEIRDAQALQAEDDAIFIDYGHMNREGAERQTLKLAEAIAHLGLLGGELGKQVSTIPGSTARTP